MTCGGAHSRRESLGIIGSALLLSALPRGAASAAARRWSIAGERVDKLGAVDAIVRRFMEDRGIRAGAVAVARQGEVLFERAYTWAEPDYPLTGTDSPIRLASVSKAFTEALIYNLVQADVVKLDIAAFPYLGLEQAALPGQSVDPRLRTITVGHLLDHRGGWDRKAAGFDPMSRMRVIANKLGLHDAPTKWDIARFMVGEPLQFTPGGEERYSNFGYLMLGLVAEKAAGDSYGNVLKQRVTAPLGLERVYVARTRKDMRLPGAGFYDQPGIGLTPEFPEKKVWAPLPYGGQGWLTEVIDAAGGMAATAGAVARFAGHYAIWGFGPRRSGRWARSGGMAGTSSCAVSRPDGTDYCVVVNTGNFPPSAMSEAVAKIDDVLETTEF
jgi:CubicO group peptidase (beta-lactamase class C family)